MMHLKLMSMYKCNCKVERLVCLFLLLLLFAMEFDRNLLVWRDINAFLLLLNA
ncbi:CLUMA_CG017641, isoform A [Clunio marinus]|uniref:CLUMA_CG017641, isoform A n=1 Tax=Clunio marinus TaxID=568069 RepID=A0A1J1IYD7_9DIPT|nr:CLUMA_CG017641, isoform A [Clunio marinus]